MADWGLVCDTSPRPNVPDKGPGNKSVVVSAGLKEILIGVAGVRTLVVPLKHAKSVLRFDGEEKNRERFSLDLTLQHGDQEQRIP